MACIYENGNNDKQDCSSGCDSGWTLYLQHSSDSQTDDDHRYFSALRTNRRGLSDEVKRSKQLLEHELMMSEEEEEDMSMVSDASSGPPHNNLTHEEEVNCHNNSESGSEECSFDSSLNRKKNKGKRRRKVVALVKDHHQSSSLLDDTASSPCLDFFSERYRVSSGSCEMLQENALDYSQGYSTTRHYNYVQMRPERGVHCDFLNSSPSSGNQIMGHDQWL